jgi:hypothetical protein
LCHIDSFYGEKRLGAKLQKKTDKKQRRIEKHASLQAKLIF